MDAAFVQGAAYAVVTIALVVFLYAYIFNLYRRQKKGLEDYEKYGNLALHDRIDDEPIEKKD